MEKEIEVLSTFGLVRTCKEVHDGVVTIVIEAANGNSKTTSYRLMDAVVKLFPDYPILETGIMDDTIAIFVLKKSSL